MNNAAINARTGLSFARPALARGAVKITTCYDHGTKRWQAAVFVASVRICAARGRDEGAAVADAVATFRTSRSARHAV